MSGLVAMRCEEQQGAAVASTAPMTNVIKCSRCVLRSDTCCTLSSMFKEQQPVVVLACFPCSLLTSAFQVYSSLPSDSGIMLGRQVSVSMIDICSSASPHQNDLCFLAEPDSTCQQLVCESQSL